MVGRSWFPPERTSVLSTTIVTDASKFAWGAHCYKNFLVEPIMDTGHQSLLTRGIFSEQE